MQIQRERRSRQTRSNGPAARSHRSRNRLMKEPLPETASIELLLANHQLVHENIKFADQKASILITLNGGLIAGVYALIDASIPRAPFLGFTICVLLAVAIGFSLWVIRPRGSENLHRGPGVIDAIRISLFTFEDFQKRVSTISRADLVGELQAFLYDRARIDERKYRYLRYSLAVSAVGWLGALSFAAWIKLAKI